LWSQIGSRPDEVLSWVPREKEARFRPPGFHALPGGLSAEAIAKLDFKTGDDFAIVSEDLAFVRAALAAVREAATPPSAALRSGRRG
jgi:hypothetical protein